MDFLQNHQLDIMLFLSGVCGILPLFTLISTTIHKKRKIAIIALEICETILLLADRFAYIYRGDSSALGFYMVRASNFLVFSQFTGLYYTFDEFNRYKREAGFFICYSIPFIITFMQLAVIIQHFNRLGKKTRTFLLVFTMIPIAASIAQIFTYGFSLTNISFVGDVVLIYVFSLVDANKKVDRANKLERDFLMQEQENIQILFSQTAEALASAIDAKDKYTHGHSMRVAEYSKQIATLTGKSPKECREIYFAALLHDVGKIGIPDTIINKEGKLTEEEFAEIKKHPVIGNKILSRITKSPYLSIGAHFHHERHDLKAKLPRPHTAAKGQPQVASLANTVRRARRKDSPNSIQAKENIILQVRGTLL